MRISAVRLVEHSHAERSGGARDGMPTESRSGQFNHHVRARKGTRGKFRSGAFDGIHVGAHARCVKPIHHEASKINARSDRIPRGSRGVVRNSNRPTSERVEQRALTGVGWSGDHHPRGRDQATEPKVAR